MSTGIYNDYASKDHITGTCHHENARRSSAIREVGLIRWEKKIMG
ncbi:MAG: hypothetical protein ACOCZV_01785 [Nanoarchaeota archaeon]